MDPGSNSKSCPGNQRKVSIGERRNPLSFFQHMFGNYGNSNEETEESLENMLMKINQTIGDKLDSNEKVLNTIVRFSSSTQLTQCNLNF